MAPTPAVELLMDQNTPIPGRRKRLIRTDNQPGGRCITLRQPGNAQGVQIRRQTAHGPLFRPEIGGPQRWNPRRKHKQHQGEGQCRQQQLGMRSSRLRGEKAPPNS